jgi:hypothetical protein
MKLSGFLKVVAIAWAQLIPNTDLFCLLDFKLSNMARALQSWSSTRIWNWFQLAVVRELVLRLDEA